MKLRGNFETNFEEIVKKSLAQKVRQKRDISERRSNSPPSALTLFATQSLGHCATCKGSSYTKNECNLFYQKLNAKYFLFNYFFRKKQYFLRKP